MKQKYYILTLVAIFFSIIYIAFSPVVKNKAQTNKEEKLQAKDDTIYLRFGHNIPTSSVLHKASTLYAQKVEEKTKGKVKIEVFPAQKLGNDHQMVELAREGKLDIILTPTAKLSVAMPSMQYADLPFYFPTKEDLYTLLDGKPGQILLENLTKIDLIGVTFWENGFKHFTANSKLERLEDFKDKKFRIMKSKLIKDQFTALEATAIPIDFHSTKKALENGVVHGQENPLIAITSMKFHEVQSNLTLTNHAYLGYVFSISAKVFKTLPSEIQDILINTAKEITNYEREETAKKEKELLKIIEDAKLDIHTLTDYEKDRIANKMKNIAKSYEEIIGTDVISKTEEYLIEKYKSDDNYIILGLDADLSMAAKVSGLAIKRGIELAIEDINKNGGLLGKEVVLLARDHSARASKSLNNIEYFEQKNNLVGLIGGLHSAVISSNLEKIKETNLPYLIPWAAAPTLTESTDNNIFRVSANDKYASTYILKEALKKFKNPAILVENSIWGRSSLEIMKNGLNKKSKHFAKIINFNRGEKNFTDEINEIVKSNADGIIMVANPIEGGKILEAVYKTKKLPIVSHWGILGGNFYENQKERLKEIDLSFIQSFSFINNKRVQAKNLALKYMSKYNIATIEKIKAPAGVAQAYDATMILAKAIKNANSLKKEDIKNSLENISEYKGVIKDYINIFNSKNHDALEKNDFFMAKYNKDGLIIKVGK
ncbi:DctP family TRAP transporter solute-binding subunit [Arcobacter sp. YIC-464]|uniref:DctP family TRAP transporter solute-binding subunit n=1 Tax=Arcobacter sp. YIC-464 TaxID=3376631 RepID=UPI003C1F3755